MSRLEEVRKNVNTLNTFMTVAATEKVKVNMHDYDWLTQQAEYADIFAKQMGKLNEFLQQKDVPMTDEWGGNVIDVVMRYVEELEKENKNKQNFFDEILDLQLYINYTEEELYREMLKIVNRHLARRNQND